MAMQYADYVAGVPLLFAVAIKVEFAGDILNVAAVVARGFDANLTQLRSDIGGGKQFVMGAAAAALKGITGEKFHFSANMGGIMTGALR